MEAKSVLEEFRRRRKLLENLRPTTATARLGEMWNFLNNTPETKAIIKSITSVDPLIKAGKAKDAKTYEEIAGVGIHILEKCNEGEHITNIVSDLDIGVKQPKPSQQSYTNDAGEFVNKALDYIEEELNKPAVAFKAKKPEKEKAQKQEGTFGKNKNDEENLQNAFIEFLKKKKGYPRESMWPVNKGGVPDLSIIEPGSKKPIVLIEFRLSNEQMVLGRLALDFLRYKQTQKLSNCLAYIVCPSLDKSSEPFEIYEIIDNGYESLLSINDFPAYEDLKKKVDTKTEVSGGEGSESEKYSQSFMLYLSRNKGYRNNSMIGEGSWQESGVLLYDVKLSDSESGQMLAVIEVNQTKKGELYVRKKTELMDKAERLGVPLYVLGPETLNSGDEFGILRLTEKGDLEQIAIEDFPDYEELKQKAAGKKLALSDFKVGLGVDGIEICEKIIELAGDSNIGLHSDIVDVSYVNLRLAGSEKTDNVAVQIHKYGEYETTIALAVVGPKKGVKVSEPELTVFVTKGEIAKLSGYKADIPGEKAWLNGNLPKTGAREKAGVYVINSEILENPDAWYDVEAILDLGVENIDKSPQKEPEKPKIEPEALSVARYAVGDSETEDDKLGFGPYVEAVAEFLVHEDTQPPLTMSVEGEWGSGKSSFMRQLKKEIKRIYSEQGKKKCFIVDFDPWRHDKDEALWAAFVLKFIQDSASSLTKRERWDANYELWKQRFQWKKAWPDVMRVILISVVWGLATVAIAIGLWKGIKLGASGTVVVPKWIGSLIAVAISGWGAFGKVKDFLGSPLTVDLKKYMKKPDYVSKISFIEKFHKDFEKIVQSYAGNERVYVFIDDLDRCRVPKAAELMESINLMLSDNPKLVFIMGMDREKVAAGLVVKHEKLLPYLSSQVEVGSGSGRNDTRMRGIRYGYSFIEKFIQIPFILPIPSSYDIENMLLEIAGEKERPTEPVKKIEEPPVEEPEPKPDVPSKETKEADRAERKEIRKEVMLKFEGDDKNFRSLVLMVSEAFGNNPRRAKKFVNLFRLRIRTAASTGLITPEERQLTFVQLGKFVGIGLGWPLFIRDLERNPRLLDKLVDVAEGENEPKDEKIKEWARDEKLIGLIKSGCFDENKKKKTGGEYERFSMRRLDVEKLMKVAPRVKQMEME